MPLRWRDDPQDTPIAHLSDLPGIVIPESQVTGLVADLATKASKPLSAIYFVDPVFGNDANDGKSWGSSFKTLNHALTVALDGTTIFCSPGVHSFSVGLVPTISIEIEGVGWGGVSLNAVYGDSSWANATGTVLKYTGTGTAINYAATAFKKFNLRKLALIGSATNGTTGISIAQDPGTHIPTASEWDDVVVGNFDTGVIASGEDMTFIDLAVGGCQTAGFAGVSGNDGNAFNNIKFITPKFQANGGNSCRINGCQQVSFDSPLFQDNLGSSLRLESCQGISIEGAPYFENPSGTHAIDMNAVANSVFRNLHGSDASTTDNINLVNCTNNTFEWPASGNFTVTLDASTHNNYFLGQWAGTITDSGGDNHFWLTQDGALEFRQAAGTVNAFSIGLLSQLWWGFWANGGTFLLRDTINNRYHMLLYPGASNTAAVSEFQSVVQADGGLNVTGGTTTLTDAVNIALGTTTGTKIGTATNQKLGFYNATPIVQPARVGQLTDSTGGTPSTTLSAQGATYSQVAVNNMIASLAAKINALETILHNNGLTA